MPVPPFLPPQLPWLFDVLVGQQWPQADEDKVRLCAQAWTDALGALVAIAQGGDQAAQRVGYSVQAISSDQFDTYWSQYTNGDDSAVGQMAKQCQALAEMLLQEAEQVEFTKLSIDIQIVILAIQLVIDIATAIVTAGASMAEGAAATMAGRFTIQHLLMELLKGAILAAAPDFITQTIMLAEGHRSSYNVGETLQAAGTGALGAAVGMGVGAVTGAVAGSLTKGLIGDATNTVGAKLTQGVIHTANAAITGALANMGTTAITDVMSGQSLDNVLSAGVTGAGGGLLFHGAHALGESLGSAGHAPPVAEPGPRPLFTTDDGTSLQGLKLRDGSYALFDANGNQHGTGTFDPASGQLDVQPVSGDPYSTSATIDHGTNAPATATDPQSQSQSTPETFVEPQARPEPAPSTEVNPAPDPQALAGPRSVTTTIEPQVSLASAEPVRVIAHEPPSPVASGEPVQVTQPAAAAPAAAPEFAALGPPPEQRGTPGEPAAPAIPEQGSLDRSTVSLAAANSGSAATETSRPAGGAPQNDPVPASAPTQREGTASALSAPTAQLPPENRGPAARSAPSEPVAQGEPSRRAAGPAAKARGTDSVPESDHATHPPREAQTRQNDPPQPPEPPAEAPVSPAEPQHPSADVIEARYGITKHNQAMFQAMADRYGLAIDVRPSNPDSLGLLEQGGVPKPEAIKAKTINERDVMLAPNETVRAKLTEMKGAVGFFEPALPERPAQFTDEQWGKLEARYEQRKQEYAELKPTFDGLEEHGHFRVVDGVVYPVEPAPIREAAGWWGPFATDENGSLRTDPETELPYRVLNVASTGLEGSAPGLVGELNPAGDLVPPVNRLPKLDPALGPPIAGDHDIFDIRDLDGNRLLTGITVSRVDSLDLALGADPKLEGAFQYFEPTMPQRPADFTDAQWASLQSRHEQRMSEFRQLDGQEAWFTKLVNEACRASDPSQGKYVIGAMPADAGEFLWRRMGVMHGAHMYWDPGEGFNRTNVYEPIIKSHKPGGEPLVRFQSGEPPTLVDSETPVRRTQPPGAADSVPGGATLAQARPEPVEPQARNEIFDALNPHLAQTPDDLSSLGPRPQYEPGPGSEEPAHRRLGPEVGWWRGKDGAWQRLWNRAPEGGMPAQEILDAWRSGQEPPGLQSAADRARQEAEYLAGLPNDGRKVFLSGVRELVERDDALTQGVLRDSLDRLRSAGQGDALLVGTEHARKLSPSISRKIDEMNRETPGAADFTGLTPDKVQVKLAELSGDLNDVQRYTVAIPKEQYAAGTREVLRDLRDQGYALFDGPTDKAARDRGELFRTRPLLEADDTLPHAKYSKDFWREGNRYRGINMTLVSPEGSLFELQFHTPESYDLKTYLTHAPYDTYRLSEMRPEQRVNALLELAAMTDKYLDTVPPGVDQLSAPGNAKDATVGKLLGKMADEYQGVADDPKNPAQVRDAATAALQVVRDIQSGDPANGRLASEIPAGASGSDLAARLRTAVERDVQFRVAQLDSGLLSEGQVLNTLAETRTLREFADRLSEPNSEAHGQMSGLGAPEARSATPHSSQTAHLGEPVVVNQNHLLFHLAGADGSVAEVHLERSGSSWVLHSGGAEGDLLLSRAARVETPRGALDIVAHATADGFVIGDKVLPFDEVLGRIPRSAQGEPIRLIACNAGAGDAAAALAVASGRSVLAADSTLWITDKGEVVASNPVDPERNWYPKRPPDGAWTLYDREGHPTALAADDPLVPKRPHGWTTADHAADRPSPEFIDLARGRKLPGAVSPIEHSLFEQAADALGAKLDRGANKAYAGAVEKMEQGAFMAGFGVEADMLRIWGMGKSPDLPRPVTHVLDDVFKIYQNWEAAGRGPGGSPLAEPLLRRSDEWVTWAGIPIHLVPGERYAVPAAPIVEHPSNLHVDFDRKGSYDRIIGTYHELQGSPERAAFTDAQFARALWNLTVSSDPAQQRALLEGLAARVEPGFRLGPDTDWTSPGGKLALFGGRLSYLLGPVEVGRNPEALTNLMNLDLAAQGQLPMDFVIKHFNSMSPDGAAATVRAKAFAEPGMTEGQVAQAIPSRVVSGSKATNAAQVIWYENTQRESLVRYALGTMLSDEFPEQYARQREQFGADPLYVLNHRPELLIALLSYRFGTVRYD